MGVKKIILATGTAAWKVGAVVSKVGGRAAASGSVWVIKKVVVNPVSMRVNDWGAVRNGKALRERLRREGACVGCGKAFRESKKREFCSPECANRAADSWNSYKQEKVKLAPADGDGGLYLNCGCNRKNTFHAASCAVGLNGHRVADNIRWSNSDPRHMKTTGPTRTEKPDSKKTARELHYERVRAAQEADRNRPWWQRKGLNG